MTTDTVSSENSRARIKELSLDQAELIEPLWQQLNTLHHSKSVHFKDHFAGFTFSERIEQLKARDSIKIFLALVNTKKVGYCLCSIHGDTGEIDSIYIDETQRKSGLGRHLVNKSLQWFKANGIEQFTVSIAHGNEEAIPFYKKFGFKPRYLVMTTDSAR